MFEQKNKTHPIIQCFNFSGQQGCREEATVCAFILFSTDEVCVFNGVTTFIYIFIFFYYVRN